MLISDAHDRAQGKLRQHDRSSRDAASSVVAVTGMSVKKPFAAPYLFLNAAAEQMGHP